MGIRTDPQQIDTSDGALHSLAPLSKTPLGQNPFERTVTVQRSSNAKLGLSVSVQDGQAVIVEKITDGIFRAYNDAEPSQAVLEGDRIVAVNGMRGEPGALIDRID